MCVPGALRYYSKRGIAQHQVQALELSWAAAQNPVKPKPTLDHYSGPLEVEIQRVCFAFTCNSSPHNSILVTLARLSPLPIACASGACCA